MHRMCQIIHTDFKPENVNIALREEEIQEISRTGQLTTTKMGKNDVSKNMNMKVAGTLGNYLNQKVNIKTGDLVPPPDSGNKDALKLSPSKSVTSDIESQSAFSTCGLPKEQYDQLTAKQKKNLRKKMQRKRKKANKAESESKSNMSLSKVSHDDDEDELPKDVEIDDIDIGVGETTKPEKAPSSAAQTPKVEKPATQQTVE